MSLAQPSSKSSKVPVESPAAPAAPASIAEPTPRENADICVEVVKAVVASPVASIKERNPESPYEPELRKASSKAVDRDDGPPLSKAAPSVPVRRKRIVDSDDSDDAPASRPSVAVALSLSDTPTAASPTSNASAKKPRVSISSSRVSAAAAGAAAASTVDESGTGAQVVDQLESKAVVDVACVTAAAAAASESSAPAKSGLKIGNPSVPYCLCLPVSSHTLSQRLNVASAATKCVDLVEGFCCCGHIVEPSFLPTKKSVTSARMIGRRPKAMMRIAFTTLRRLQLKQLVLEFRVL
jgi:hypothetical protein